MKKFSRFILIIAVLSGTIYAARHALTAAGLQFALRKMTGEQVCYTSRSWRGGVLIYRGFSLGEKMMAEEVAIEFSPRLFPFHIESKVRISSPYLQLDDAESPPLNLAFLIPTKYSTVKLDMQNGTLAGPGAIAYGFDFASGKTEDEIGTATVYQEKAAPLVSCGFGYADEKICLDLKMEEAPIEKILNLASLFHPVESWNMAEGSATAVLQGAFNEDSLVSLNGHVGFQNLRWESEELIFALDSARADVDYRGELKTLRLDTDFNGADLFWKELEVVRGQGSIVFKPQAIPTFEVHAAVNIAHLEGRTDLVGQGEIQPEGTLSLDGICYYVTAAQACTRVDFSWADDGTSQVLQTEIHNLGKELLSLLTRSQAGPQAQQGSIDGKLITFFDKWSCQRMRFENLRGHQLSYGQFSMQEMEAEGVYDVQTGTLEQMTLQAHEGEGQWGGSKFSGLHAAVSVKNNCFESSSAFGLWEKIPLAVEFEGPLSSFHATAKLSAGASQWLRLSLNPEEPSIVLEMTLDRDREQINIAGAFLCNQDRLELKAQASLTEGGLQGTFQAPRIQPVSYMPFFSRYAPDLEAEGELFLSGHFTHEAVDLIARVQDMAVIGSEWHISMPGPSQDFSYHFDFAQKQGAGNGKLSPLFIISEKIPFDVAISEGNLAFDNALLTCCQMKAQLNASTGGIEMEGDFRGRMEEKLQARFIAQKVEGSVESLLAAARYFKELPVQLETLKGSFSCPSDGLQLDWAGDDFNYRIQAAFHDINAVLTPRLFLEETQFQLSFDTLTNQMSLQDLQGALGSLQEKVGFKAGKISCRDHAWNFDAAFVRLGSPILSLHGSAVANAQGYDVVLKEAQSFSSHLKSPLSFHWSPPEKIDRLQGVVFLETSHLAEQFAILEKLGLLEVDSKIQQTLRQFQGSMTIQLMHNEGLSEYELEGSQLQYASTLFQSAKASILHQGSEWTLKRCRLDDLQMHGRILYQNEKWLIPTWDVAWKKLHLQTSGVYEKDRFDFTVEGQIDAFPIQGSGIFVTSVPCVEQLSLQVLQSADPLASLSCEELSYREGKWESPALNLTVDSNHLTHALRTQLRVSIGSQSATFQGPISQGDIQIGKSLLKFTQIYGLYEDDYLNLKCVTALDGDSLQLIGKFLPGQQFAGGVSIQNKRELLRLSLSDISTLQTIQGELFGVSLDLERNSPGFQGTVELKDGSKIADLADNEQLRDLSGVLLKGFFGKKEGWTFKGQVEGQDVIFKEYMVQELHAQAEYTPAYFQLRNISVQDPAGSFSIKECKGLLQDGEWNVSIPLLKGQEIKPSGLRKKGAPAKEIKPLQIRHLVMTDLKGQLGDLASFRGEGSFNFSQREKKEPSLLDIPMAFLKDLGLDPDLFTPTIGEVSVQLKNGKLYFTGLQNTYSDGKRSEFYLAGEPSFIDLDGGLHLNLRMQQHAVLKLVEPFMIAVRGTWEKPQYSLQ
jgi:hypothetical protein